jgi:tetratricopeptide (TPR) repeat protein
LKKMCQLALLVALPMMTSVAAARGDEFYEARLRAGEAAYAEKRLPEAIDNLRIAAFGLLESPPLEAEALAYLALAQSATGRAADTDATLGRFLEVERRFAPYAKLKLDPAVRAEFQALLLRRVSQPTLLAYPGLAVLVETEEQKIAKLPPKDRARAYEAAARREPGSARWPLALARDAEAAGDTKAAIAWSSKAIEIEPGNAEARSVRAHAYFSKGDFAAARADLSTLPATEIEVRPMLLGDRFVCFVELKDWGPASEAAKTLPSGQAARPDVIRAQERLAAQQPRAAR